MARGAHSFTNQATLEAFDDVSLWEILSRERKFCESRDFFLPARPGDAIDRTALSELLRSVDPAPPPGLLDAFLTIAEAATERLHSKLIDLATQVGIPPEDIIGDDVTPVMLAARIWRHDEAALKRLLDRQQVEGRKGYDSYWADADEVPELRVENITEEMIAEWRDRLTEKFVERGHGGGVTISIVENDGYVHFLIRHGATPKLMVEHQPSGEVRNNIYRPSNLDILRYDTATGILGVHRKNKSRWLEDLYLTTFSLEIFRRAHLFCAQAVYTLEPLRQRGPAILECEHLRGIEKIDLVRIGLDHHGDLRLETVHKGSNLFAALAAHGVDWRTFPAICEATFAVTFSTGDTRNITIKAPNNARCGRHGDEVLLAEWLEDAKIKLEKVTADEDRPDF